MFGAQILRDLRSHPYKKPCRDPAAELCIHAVTVQLCTHGAIELLLS